MVLIEMLDTVLIESYMFSFICISTWKCILIQALPCSSCLPNLFATFNYADQTCELHIIVMCSASAAKTQTHTHQKNCTSKPTQTHTIIYACLKHTKTPKQIQAVVPHSILAVCRLTDRSTLSSCDKCLLGSSPSSGWTKVYQYKVSFKVRVCFTDRYLNSPGTL